MGLDERKRSVLCAVVDVYIRTGEPVGSNAVLANLGMNVSSATVRNDMAALEQIQPLKIFGGCCGTDSSHMQAIAKKLSGQ